MGGDPGGTARAPFFVGRFVVGDERTHVPLDGDAGALVAKPRAYLEPGAFFGVSAVAAYSGLDARGAGLNVPDRDENAATNIEADGLRVVIRPEDPGALRAFGDERRCSDGARACGRVSANSEAVSLSGTG